MTGCNLNLPALSAAATAAGDGVSSAATAAAGGQSLRTAAAAPAAEVAAADGPGNDVINQHGKKQQQCNGINAHQQLPLQPQQQLQLLDMIGRGTFASVYRAI